MASITCATCGTVNQANASYCRSCGFALQAAAAAGITSSTVTGRLPPNSLLKQRYRIIASVGKGGMGAVYVAEDTQLGNRLVAIKEMSQSGLNKEKLVEATNNFKKEAIILSHLQHPHLPSVYDHFADSGRWYLVMSYIQGETLQDYLEKVPDRKLPVKEVLDIGIQLCTVLDYLHNQHPPIIFRDLKPSNIMRMPNGRLYLIDFGIARHFKPGQAKDTVAFGSVGYSAPEQYGKEQTTPRSDIYSLGALLHELLSGHVPALSPFRFPPLPSVPTELETLIMQMLDMDVDQRPPDMATVGQRLQQIARYSSNPDSTVSNIPSANADAFAPTMPVKPPTPMQQQVFFPPTQPFQSKTPSTRRIGKQQLVAAIIGILVCGFLKFSIDLGIVHGGSPSWFTFSIGSAGIVVDPAFALTCVLLVLILYFGAVFGPWIGVIVGGVGTLGADLLSGLGITFWYWDIGLALAGFVIGLTLLKAPRGQKRRNIVLTICLGALAITIFTVLDLLLAIRSSDFAYTLNSILGYVAIYLVVCVPILIILLIIYNSVVSQPSTP